MQLMRRFQSDNLNMQLHQEAREWPDANFFLDALPNPSHDILSPADFDTTVTPGPKSVISSLSPCGILSYVMYDVISLLYFCITD